MKMCSVELYTSQTNSTLLIYTVLVGIFYGLAWLGLTWLGQARYWLGRVGLALGAVDITAQ